MTVDSSALAPGQVRERFSAADWSLLSAERGDGEFHPYPARYIPAIPAQVIELLEIGDGLVLDPFCGSGTTLAEARRRGLSTVGVDINPIACLISRVRTSTWSTDDDGQLETHLSGLLDAASTSSEVGDEFIDIPRLDHWFPHYAQIALSGAVRYVRSLPPEDPWHDRVAAAVSAATVKISRQDSDTRYAAIEKAGDQGSVARALRLSLSKTGNWLRRNTADYDPATTSTVLLQDARDLSHIGDGSVSLACFSPPYPNAYEYWLYHKYRMYWLGFDAVAVRGSEMGARPYYSKKNGLTELDFAKQMSEVFSELRRVLRPGGYMVMIVGDSVIGGRAVDNGSLLADAARDAGFICDYSGLRNIETGKSSFNRAHSRGRKTEHVIVLRSRA